MIEAESMQKLDSSGENYHSTDLRKWAYLSWNKPRSNPRWMLTQGNETSVCTCSCGWKKKKWWWLPDIALIYSCQKVYQARTTQILIFAKSNSHTKTTMHQTYRFVNYHTLIQYCMKYCVIGLNVWYLHHCCTYARYIIYNKSNLVSE